MEAYEEKEVKRDSFEEVDRILTIVEDSKKDLEKESKYLYTTLSIVLTAFLLTSIGGIEFLKKANDNVSRSLIDDKFIFYTIILFIVTSSFILVRGLRTYKQNLLKYNITVKQAAEIIREIVPTLSRSENWSALRKFELSLRLSKLGIGTELIFETRFDLPF